MQTRGLKRMLAGAMGVVALLVVGCSPDSTSSGLATIRVSLGRADATASTAVATGGVTTAGAVDLASVASLTVTLDSVQLQTSSSQGWQTLNFTSLPVNLLDLSTPIDLGEVQVETGSGEVRMFVSDATITFSEDVVVGQQTFLGGTTPPTEYPVRIPSGDQTGLKADGTFDATMDPTHVTLGFDGVATVGTIVATGNGILLTPVIHVVQP
jgi:hypothetical protein